MSEQATKKELILRKIEELGSTNTREVWEAIAHEGTVVDITYVRRIVNELQVSERANSGAMMKRETQPFATSGITGNPVANEYLKGIQSSGGGFLKTAVYDIETTNLQADFGYLLSCCIKDIDTGEIKVFRLDETKWFLEAREKYQKGEKSNWTNEDFWDVIDIELCDLVRKELNDYNLVITHNGRWFDERFLQTRFLRCGLEGLNPGTKHFDTLQLARKVLQTRSKKLDSIKNFLRIDDEPDTHNWAMWRMAQAGVKEGFDFIVDHNVKDVEQLHQVAQKLRHHAKFWFF